MKQYKIIKVEWEDITFFKGFYNEEDLKNLVSQRIETIGHFIKEEKEYLIIALSLELTEPYRIIDLIKIPKSNIIKRKWITQK